MTYHSPPWIEKKVEQYQKAVNDYLKAVRGRKSKAICDRYYENVREIYRKLADADVKITLFKRIHT